jgi:ferric-dicitrate binding protein FerR (iron transport regulator)
MEQEQLWTLLGKRLAGVATEEELQELELLLLAYGEDAAAVEIIQRMWTSRQKKEDTGDSDAAGINDAIRNRIDASLGISESTAPAMAVSPQTGSRGNRTRVRSWLIAGTAAAFLIVVCIGIFGRSENDKAETMLVLFTRKRSHSNLRFPDGTSVVLNENSRISYNADFGKVRREIILEGEAYFDVARNPGIPLIIHAGNVDIKVLGTSFNVKAYPLDKGVETSLIRGMVEVSSKRSPERKVLLRPNEKVTIPMSEGIHTAPDKDPAPLQDETDSNAGPGLSDTNPKDTLSYHLQPLQAERSSKLIPEIAWMYRKLVFNQEPFGSVAEKMGRWYDVNFYFEDDDLKEEVFTGSFSKETLEEALKALQFSYHFNFIIKKREVFIQKK